MKRAIWAVGFLGLVFAVAYALAFEASSWVGVYWLDWWDGKFGDRAGNIAFDHQLLPFFAGLALLSHLFASIPLRQRLRGAPAGRLAAVGVAAAVAAHGTWFLFAVATRSVGVHGAWAGAAHTAGMFLLVGGPGVATYALTGALIPRAHVEDNVAAV